MHDYRVLAPTLVTDPNGNRSAARFDAVGRLEVVAVMGKVGSTDGDTLDEPTMRYEYGLTQWSTAEKPNFVHTFAREEHGPSNPRWVETYVYTNGGGGVAMTKVQAEPGPGDTERWVGTGRTVLNNKGNPVKQYEPYFSETPDYEDEDDIVATGVTPVLTYDPLGRLVRTDLPNGSYSRAEWNGWEITSFDTNDTVLEPGNLWCAARQSTATPTPSAEEQRARALTEAHANTPAKAYLDSMGRTFLVVAHNGFDVSDDPILFETRTVFDIEGQVLAVKDAWGRVCQTYAYSMAGLVLKDSNIDKGSRWTISDFTGAPIRRWDDLGQAFMMGYDVLRRPTHLMLTVGITDTLLERRVYGEAFSSPEADNLRGKLALLYDEAGEATSLSYDFKGNPLETTRTLRTAYATGPDWSALGGLTNPTTIRSTAAGSLESETFTETREYDALNRVTAIVAPDDSRIEPTYNEAGLLEAVNVFVRGGGTATNVVKNIDYDAKGQRLAIEYSADPTTGDARFTTTYTYDPLTFRLATCETLRDPSPQRVQDLSYTYDPSGNIVEIIDDAQQTVFFNNSVVLPANRYEYDPIYRLIRAEGREHASLGIVTVDENDCPLENLPHANMTDAVRNYFEEYLYDRVGNILELFHSAAGTPAATWTRKYEYAPTTSGVPNTNRLRSTYSSAPPTLPHYAHDAHGNMTSMPHLATITYNAFDQMASSDAIGGGTAFYVYASGGQRMRKVWEETGSIVHERIYLGGFEIYRKKISGTPTLERETLHVMDGIRRIVMIETKTVDTSGPFTVTPRLRFQLDNHLGSAMLELTEDAERISYEEYHPYGTSAYRSRNGSVEVSARRYRYTGKERDEETGLYYYGARYYASWLGRWTSADPSGIGADGPGLYNYTRGSPVTLTDPNGRDAIITVDMNKGTIVYSTTIHLYVDRDHAQSIRNAADRAEEFFRSPKIVVPERNSKGEFVDVEYEPIVVDEQGKEWTVSFDVNYVVHTEQSPLGPMPWSAGNTPEERAEFVNRLQVMNSWLHTSGKLATGENLLTYYDSNAYPGARTEGGRVFHGGGLAAGELRILGGDQDFMNLIHESGHFLGYDERYWGTSYPPELRGVQPGFQNDLMSSSSAGVARLRNMHGQHLVEAAQFALGFAEGSPRYEVQVGAAFVDETTGSFYGTEEYALRQEQRFSDALEKSIPLGTWDEQSRYWPSAP